MKRLTRQQIDVIRLICEGCEDHEIAQRLGISFFAVRSSIRAIRERLNARNKAHAAAIWTALAFRPVMVVDQ